MKLTPYHAKYFAFELTKKNSADSMEKLASTLVDAQVDLNPHQVEAALFAFKSPLSKGAILADEVGLGKTIEAGLVISQKWAERKRKILIIAPSNLRKQWSQELQDKFFIPSVILEAKSFNEQIKKGNLNPFIQPNVMICSYQFARSKDAYIRAVNWDLAVIDEAHRLRNVYKPSNKIAKAIKNALEHSPKILLTATPLQNSLQELYGLVSIIDDYSFGDLKSFRNQYSRAGSTADDTVFDELKERLKPICKRTLRRQVTNYIKYTNRIALVEEFYPSDDEQRLYDLVTDYLQEENLYALPSGQRKLMTLILRRLLASSTYAISSTLEGLAKKLENTLSHSGTQNSDNEIAENFETFDELKDEWDDNDDIDSKSNNDLSADDIANIKREIASLKEFERLAKSIRINSKGEKLFTALERGFSEMKRLDAPQKAIIFTESTRTQEYLRNILEARGYANKVVLFNGNNTDEKSKEIYKDWIEKHKNTDILTGSRSADMRAALVDNFKNESTIMIATEAAAEGINLQFCSMLINFDMPWNPQRIEQRIGRCHRYGQKYDVVVVNFLNKANAADVRVYDLLEEKFKLFDGVFGASDEVLGSIENGVDFEKRIAEIYQNCRTNDEINNAFDKLKDEYKDDIADEFKRTRHNLLENFDEEVHEKLRINLKESKEYLSKYEALLWNITKFYLKDNAEYATDEHSFKLLHNPFGDLVIYPGPYKIGKNTKDANIYRIGHPLAQQIIESCKNLEMAFSEVYFDLTNNPTMISALNDYKNLSGYLLCRSFSVTSFETEEYLQMCAVTDDGEVMENDVAERLFSLSAEVRGESTASQTEIISSMQNILAQNKSTLLELISTRNMEYFQVELDKLDNWGEDKRSSLKFTLKDLDMQIKEIKKAAKSAPNLPEKLKLERERRKLDSERDSAWRDFDQAAKEIEKSKDNLIEDIEKKLEQEVIQNDLFLIRWHLK
ncbi:SNF2-related protein [Kaistella sp. PBT33-4]|uniref:SNF2-related protein n=1 Tax=Kaistella sp. PBT33-4 TaxID=3032000 RepID=UPI0023D8301B|nr:SNF2-related protein [Kaistella sp. PBT33-4]MDF0720812.1 SNF2-related protein [Kaistella sp. PBT33-4]